MVKCVVCGRSLHGHDLSDLNNCDQKLYKKQSSDLRDLVDRARRTLLENRVADSAGDRA